MFEPIYRSNDYRAAFYVEAPGDDNVDAPVTSLVLTVWLSLTAYDPAVPGSGAAIHGDLTATATALAGAPGWYEVVYDGDKIDLRIPEDTKHVYIVSSAGDKDIKTSDRVPVRSRRRAA